MSDFSSFEGFRDTLIGMLAAAVIGLAGLVRRLDVGEISRRLDVGDRRADRLEAEVYRLRERIAAHDAGKEGRATE